MNPSSKINFRSSRFILKVMAGSMIFLFGVMLISRFEFDRQEIPATVVLTSLAGILMAVILIRIQVASIYQPLEELKKYITDLSAGKTDSPKLKASNQEIEQLVSSLTQLSEGTRKTTEFAKEMGKGNFSASYTSIGSDDHLGNSLLEMRKNMLAVSEAEKKRNWVNEGLAMFSELLRRDTNDIHKFSDNILTQLVKYLGANQGRFFILNEEEETLTLTACYAWGRKKHIDSVIKIGEGLAGQVVLEKEPIFLTNIPDNYISITSGLGEANPKCIILLPLKYNEEVFGVIELASFQIFEPFQREFLDKMCVSIASSISTVKINVRTRKLLEDSMVQSRELKEKDGIMRQNMEEMRATQEDMQRKETEMKHMEWKTNAILEGCVECIIAFNHNGTIEFFNKAAQDIWGITREDAIGTNVSELLPVTILEEAEGCGLYYTNQNNTKKFAGKTELNIQNQHNEEITIICSISQNKIGDKCFFTAFIQNMTVEIF